MHLDIKISFSDRIVEKQINYPRQDKINIEFTNVAEPITVQGVTVNGLPANPFHNSKYQLPGSRTDAPVYNIKKNGLYTLTVDDFYLRCLRARHWHMSKHNDDFIFQYQHTNNSYVDTYRDRDLIGFAKEFIPCFGCSFTFGQYLDSEHSWPYLLSKKTGKNYLNLGVPGIGVDIIENNLKRLYAQNKFSECVILVPALARRIISSQIDGFYIKVPSTLELPPFEFSYLSQLQKIAEDTKHKIVLDNNDEYSKNKLHEIFDFCERNKIKVYASSFMPDVIDFLAQCRTIRLPDYPPLHQFPERARDGAHPHLVHNQCFVDSITNFL